MSRTIEDHQWEQARSLPKMDPNLTLIAHLAMCGKKVVCPGLSRKFGERLLKIWDEDEDEHYDLKQKAIDAGFTYHENHARSGAHEWFQDDLPEGIVLPIEEACQLAANDPDWDDDGVTITRLVYSKDRGAGLASAIDKIFE